MPSSIVEAVYGGRLKTPDKAAVIDAFGIHTYHDMIAETVKYSELLSKKGIVKGDCVIAECTQDFRFLCFDLACEYVGAIFVPVEQAALEARVTEIYSETEAKLIVSLTDYSSIGSCASFDEFTSFECTDYVLDETRLPKENDVAEILYSTGTTGKPKGIVLSNRANVAVAENIIAGTAMEGDAVELIPLPLSHSHGLRTCYANFVNGSSVAVINGVMNVALFFSMINKYGVNALDVSPTLAKLLIKIAKRGLKDISANIRYIELGTSMLEDEVKEQLKELFPNSRLYNFYGSTEAGRSCVYDFNKEDYSKCIGYPSPHAKFMITDESRNPIRSSKENPGLVAISGKMMMEGYFKAPELTAQTVVDGVIYSSDLGYIDEAGRVYVFGRADDVINYKGIKIAPEEIESVAVKYAGIADCACVPMADKLCGQVPKLFIEISSDSFSMDDYMNYLKTGLDISRVPVAVEIIDRIPRTSNGKLQRKKLLQ